MFELFGKKEIGERPLKRDRDERILIETARNYLYLSKNEEEEEAINKACRDAVKIEIKIREYDGFKFPENFNTLHKYEIDKDFQRIKSKFKRFKNKYLILAKELDKYEDFLRDQY